MFLICNITYPWLAVLHWIFVHIARAIYFCLCCFGWKKHYSTRVSGDNSRIDKNDLKTACDPLMELNLATLAAANTKKCRAGLPLQCRLNLDWDLCKY